MVCSCILSLLLTTDDRLAAEKCSENVNGQCDQISRSLLLTATVMVQNSDEVDDWWNVQRA